MRVRQGLWRKIEFLFQGFHHHEIGGATHCGDGNANRRCGLNGETHSPKPKENP